MSTYKIPTGLCWLLPALRNESPAQRSLPLRLSSLNSTTWVASRFSKFARAVGVGTRALSACLRTVPSRSEWSCRDRADTPHYRDGEHGVWCVARRQVDVCVRSPRDRRASPGELVSCCAGNVIARRISGAASLLPDLLPNCAQRDQTRPY
jgi:hypothetical protein